MPILQDSSKIKEVLAVLPMPSGGEKAESGKEALFVPILRICKMPHVLASG